VIPRATILYEDSRIGVKFPLHHLVLRMVKDEFNGETYRLLRAVKDNPKSGIDKLLGDVRQTRLIAGRGMLFVLADRDHVVEHINRHCAPARALSAAAGTGEIERALKAWSDAPEKLGVFLLEPNVEGIIDDVARCAPDRWRAEVSSARQKDRIARDFVFDQVARATEVEVRRCLLRSQPGLAALAKALGGFLQPEVLASDVG